MIYCYKHLFCITQWKLTRPGLLKDGMNKGGEEFVIFLAISQPSLPHIAYIYISLVMYPRHLHCKFPMPICLDFSCLFAVLFKESGDSPPRDGPVPDDEPAKETREASQVPREVLDFSSGSEEDEDEQGLRRKMSKPSAVGGNRGGNVAIGPARLSLLQHGFSELFEGVKGKPALGEGDSSPSVGESPSEEDAKDQKEEDTSSSNCNAGNGVVRLPKLGTKTWDICSSSDKEDSKNREEGRQKGVSLVNQSDETVRKRRCLKGWTNKTTTEDEESGEYSSHDKKKPNKLNRTVPKVHHFEVYSDESEDLDIEKMTRPKKKASDSYGEGGDERRRKAYCNRKRQNASIGDKARSKYSKDIEMFTSSEDEHTPFKKGRPARCHFTSAQTESSRVELPKYGRTTGTTEIQAGMSKAVSFTRVKSPTSAASKGMDGTIDSVLGQAHYTFLCAHNFNQLNFTIKYMYFCLKGQYRR